MPRYRTRGGVEFEASPSVAAFVGAESVGGDQPSEEEQGYREPIAPAQPEGGPAEPVQEPAQESSAAEPVQEPPPPAEDAQQTMTEAAPATQEIQAQPAPPPAPEQDEEGTTDYRSLTTTQLKAEIRRRNEDRPEDDQLPLTGDKADLVATLEVDDADNQ
jgi:hypothetical protein